MERRLAAILASDVVGYSRLMQLDEPGTLAALAQRRQQVLEPLVVKHHGRIVKVMGDGVLIEFARPSTRSPARSSCKGACRSRTPTCPRIGRSCCASGSILAM